MYKVRAIKVITFIEITIALVCFIAAGSLFNLVDKAQRTSDYYWSREFRSGVSDLTETAIFALSIGGVSLLLGLNAAWLAKTGKVCPQCEKVYFSSLVKCPICGTDMTYAKKVDEYLAENPTVSGTVSSSGKINPPGADSGTNVSDRRYCVKCGREVHRDDAFCPHCGEKQ